MLMLADTVYAIISMILYDADIISLFDTLILAL